MRFLLGALLTAELGLAQEIARPDLATACPELAVQCAGDSSSILSCLRQFNPDALVPGLCQDTLRAYLAAPPRTRRSDESKQSDVDDSSHTSVSKFHQRDHKEKREKREKRDDRDSDDEDDDNNRSGSRNRRSRGEVASSSEGRPRERGDWQRDNVTREARWPNTNATLPSRDRSPKSRGPRGSDRSPEGRLSSPEGWLSSRIKNNATSYRRRQASWEPASPSDRRDEGGNSRSWRRVSSWRREAAWNATHGTRSVSRGPRFGDRNITRGEWGSFRERRESDDDSIRSQANATRTWDRQRSGDYKNSTREERRPRKHDGEHDRHRGGKDGFSINKFDKLAHEVHELRKRDRSERHRGKASEGGKAGSQAPSTTAQFPDVPAEVPVVPSSEVAVLNTQA